MHNFFYRVFYGEEESVMTEEVVNVCAGMLLVGRWGARHQPRVAEQAAGKLLYYDYAKQSPVMLDMYR